MRSKDFEGSKSTSLKEPLNSKARTTHLKEIFIRLLERHQAASLPRQAKFSNKAFDSPGLKRVVRNSSRQLESTTPLKCVPDKIDHFA